MWLQPNQKTVRIELGAGLASLGLVVSTIQTKKCYLKSPVSENGRETLWESRNAIYFVSSKLSPS